MGEKFSETLEENRKVFNLLKGLVREKDDLLNCTKRVMADKEKAQQRHLTEVKREYERQGALIR